MTDAVDVLLTERVEAGRTWPLLVWAPGPGYRMISTAVDGGGLGERHWWLNTQVSREYFEPDPVVHVRRIAAAAGLRGPGVGMLTAADVRRRCSAEDGGVRAVVTVGLGLPVPAAASPERIAEETAEQPVDANGRRAPGGVPGGIPGTINVLVVLPVALQDPALVNLVITATEAKTQALIEAGVPGTGTSSDAVCIACPTVPAASDGGGAGQAYGGPRSTWGARAARAVHAAVAAGTADWLALHPAGDMHRRRPGLDARVDGGNLLTSTVPSAGGIAQDGAMGSRLWTTVPSPVGELLLGTDGGALTELLFERHRDGADPMLDRVRAGERADDHPLLRRAVDQLGEYFARQRQAFDLPLEPSGSAFQQRVWAALREVPYGTTTSYGEIARRLGLPPGASRAVGLANGANPISIVIPCHRVIGANGSLTGYGGGLHRKRILLDLESDQLF